MLKKYLTAILSLILIAISILGVSLVSAYALTETETINLDPTYLNPTDNTERYPKFTQGPFVTVPHYPEGVDFSKEDLAYHIEFFENALAYKLDKDGIYENMEKFKQLMVTAKEIYAKDNPTQEELNDIVGDLLTGFLNLFHIGYIENPFIIGDYDNDANVTIKDATEVQMRIAELHNKDYNYAKADANGDFYINIKDVTMLQCYCAGYTDELSCGRIGQYDTELFFNKEYRFD